MCVASCSFFLCCWLALEGACCLSHTGIPLRQAILEDKYWVIFVHFNDMLDDVQNQYERHKHSPPVVRK